MSRIISELFSLMLGKRKQELEQIFSEEVKKRNFSTSDICRNIRDISFSSSGEKMFVKDDYYLEVTGGKKPFRRNSGKIIISPSFSPFGKEIMFVECYHGQGNNCLKILDYETEMELFSKVFKNSDCSPSFSSSNKEIIMLVEGDSNLKVLNIKNGNEVFSKSFSGRIDSDSPKFSNSGEEIILTECQFGLVILDSKTGEEIFSKKFKERVLSPSFSPSDREVIIMRDGWSQLEIIDRETGKKLFSKKLRQEKGLDKKCYYI